MSTRWCLNDLYKGFDAPEFLADFEAAKEEIVRFTKWAEDNFKTMDNAGEKLVEGINAINEGSRIMVKLGTFAMLVRSVDDDNQDAKKYGDMLRVSFADMAKPRVMFEAYVGKVEDLDGLINAHPVLKEHEFILREIKSKNKYLLSQGEEVVFAKLKNTGSSAWNDMKEQLTATMKIPVVVDGEEKVLPLPAVRNLAFSTNPQTRKDAYEAEMKAYESVEKAVAGALNAIKGEALTAVAMRGYDSPLHMTLENSRMEQATLDSMISAMEDFLPSFRRFYKKKAEILGHKNGLPWYDIMASTSEVDMKFTLEEGRKFCLDNFYKFSQKMGDFTKHAFDNHWVDSEVREGKRGGAFCMGVHSIGQSRIMENFNGTFSNVTTTAHEFGHAYHNLCLKDKTALNSTYTMPIAETASNFCESIVIDAALAEADEKTKRAILEQDLSDSMQVIVDIYSRFLFEKRLFEARANGSLSVDEINDLMLQAQKDAYGDGLDQDVLHKYMWINKPHYYYVDRNFYNFPYAYGLMFSKGLYAQYLEQGEAFLEKYDNLLAATGSASLEEVGDMAGINVRKKDFWVSSLKLIDSKLDEFCKL
ncbi:MAG: M3 family oligoendopeptidase [Defluviitaleaceae bacterium]|nr:M3 family oligoendopeptidase [Defluviitaleaceae bacterium]